MIINFPFINTYLYRQPNINRRSNLSPLPFDTFEKISFGATANRGTPTYSFDIKNIKNIRCPVCGLITLTDQQVKDFIDDVRDKRGYDLVETLEKYEDDSCFTGVKEDHPRTIFREQKQEIVDIIKDLAIDYPKKSLSELVDIEAQKRIQKLISEQMKVVDELEQFIRRCNATKDKKDYAKGLLEEYKKQIYGNSNVRFSRKKFICDFSNIGNDPTTKAQMTEICEKLPTSKQDVNSWFVKYSKSLTSADIAKKLVQESIPTAEHLIPRSKEGGDSLKNYICDCAECNSKRSNLEFDIWMKTIPNFKEKLQQYLQDVQNAIDTGKISRKYNTYIETIIETISKLSNGQIILDMPNSTDSGKRVRMLVKREGELERIAKHIKEQSKQRKEKESEIEELESHPYYQKLFLLETLERSLEACREEMNDCSDSDKLLELKGQMKSIQEQIDTCRDYIANAGYIDDSITQLQGTISVMERTQAQLSRMETQIHQEGEIREKQKQLLKRNIELNVQNSKIMRSPGFDEKDKTDFKNYLHLLELLKTAEDMVRNYGKLSKASNREVVQIGLRTIKKTIENYLKKDSVIYFLNSEELQKGRVEIEELNLKLEEIESKKSLTELYEKDIMHAGKGRTLEQLREELKRLNQSKEDIKNIHELPQFRAELENLSEAISFNKGIYSNLKRHYTTMTNEEFLYQLSSVC